MHQTITTEEIRELAQEGAEVVTTVYDLGTAQIRLATKNDLSLVTVSGTYDRRIAKEIERIAARAHGNLGLEFKKPEAQKDRPGLRFDASLGTLLRRLQAQCDRRGKVFLICNPPAELTDALKLLDIEGRYAIVDERTGGVPAHAPQTRPQSRERRMRPPPQPAPIHRKIFQLNQSLKRTESLEKGLDSAARCVAKLLPQEPPRIPGYEFAFIYRSSEKVGGDFFDFIELGPDSWAIAIGDVSGHGLDAALVMGISKKLIQIRTRDLKAYSPAVVLRQVGVDLEGDFGRRTFVTAILAKLNLAQGTIHLARAGHEFPIYFRPGGKQQVLESKGTALGLTFARGRRPPLEELVLRLQPGSCLLLFTDGLTECRGDRDALYTRERLLFELRRLDPGSEAQEMLERLIQSVDRFAGDRPQEDDLTVILVRRTEETAGTAASRPPSGGDSAPSGEPD